MSGPQNDRGRETPQQKIPMQQYWNAIKLLIDGSSTFKITSKSLCLILISSFWTAGYTQERHYIQPHKIFINFSTEYLPLFSSCHQHLL